jgi:anti-anti-sigma factor
VLSLILQITPTDEGFRLDGELDMATADDLSQVLRDASTNHGGDPIVLDFSGVSFMDSSGLRALLEAAGLLNGNGSMVILNPPAQVRRVLDISIPGGTPGLEVRG